MQKRNRYLAYAASVLAIGLASGCVASMEAEEAASAPEVHQADAGMSIDVAEAELKFIDGRKRNYCCKTFDDFGLVQSCRNIRQYRNEAGHLIAQAQCHDNYNGRTDLERRSCEHIAECPRPPATLPPRPAPGTCSNGQPDGARWSEIERGTSCHRNHYECRSGEIFRTGSSRESNCIEL